MTDEREMSKMLFAAREELAMWADVVEARTGKTATHTRSVLEWIDNYRRDRGWSPHGFGGEPPPDTGAEPQWEDGEGQEGPIEVEPAPDTGAER